MAEATVQHLQDRLFAVFTIDGRRFFLPQEEVHSVELVIDINNTDPLPRTVGWCLQSGEKWPLYCLDRELNVLNYIPSSRKASVLIDNHDFSFGVLCDQVSSLEIRHLMTHPIPKCMTTPRLPIGCLVVVEGKVECFTTTALLAGMLQGASPESVHQS